MKLLVFLLLTDVLKLCKRKTYLLFINNNIELKFKIAIENIPSNSYHLFNMDICICHLVTWLIAIRKIESKETVNQNQRKTFK